MGGSAVSEADFARRTLEMIGTNLNGGAEPIAVVMAVISELQHTADEHPGAADDCEQCADLNVNLAGVAPVRWPEGSLAYAQAYLRMARASFGASTAAPPAWTELLTALVLLSREPGDDISPTFCSHDQLTVAADPHGFTDDETSLLARLGFTPGDDCFTSTRFGN